MVEFDIIKRNLLGLPIHDVHLIELLKIIDFRITNRIKTIVYGFSAGIYPRLKHLPEFVTFFNHMDIVISDGAGIIWLSKLFSVKIRERIGIPRLANNLLTLANDKSYKVLLFGGKKEVNDLANENIQKEFPAIKFGKGIDGYFGHHEESKIVEIINYEKPDILFIGISSPVKEKFALKYKDQLDTKIILPCGGMIDVWAGLVKRPPFELNWLPLNWFFRFIQEPRRLYGTTVKLVLQLSFFLLPVLYIKHLFRIERNPSVIKHYGISTKKLDEILDLFHDSFKSKV